MITKTLRAVACERPAHSRIPALQSSCATQARRPSDGHSIVDMQRTHGNRAVQRLLTTRYSLVPHDASLEVLRNEAGIYAQGKTPVRMGGQVIAWDAKPLGVEPTGVQLQEIERRFGSQGVAQSVRGLAQSRGEDFARGAAKHAGVSPDAAAMDGQSIGGEAARAILASHASKSVSSDLAEDLTRVAGPELGRLEIHDDAEAHRAADLLGARAFTIGHQIFFARNEYQPATPAGKHLIAHEAAHSVQQHASEPRVNDHARVVGSGDREEEEASHFADAVVGRRSSSPSGLSRSGRSGIVHRAISFTHDNDRFTTNLVAVDENATGFRLASNPAPAFQWDSDVTIHGVAGDPFGHFEVGFQQVERSFGVNVHWGSGANETHRKVRPDHLPRRDATAAANTWYDDGGVSLAAPFAANGDVRSPSFDDTPGTARFPWTNPHPGRVSHDGWFNFGDAFVTYLSARDRTAGTGAAAFRDIANVYWNLSATGTFDSNQPVGGRVALATNPVNHSGVIEGGSAEFPALHGGNIANGHDVTTDT